MTASDPVIKPRIIIHGGAGNISRANVPDDSYNNYRSSLQRILRLASASLAKPDATALDVATYAVSLFEDDPLFNAGKGAVFTRAGTNELEASVMVSRGHHKRGTGCILLNHVKNPIKLAREMLLRGDDISGGGAQHHVQLSGPYLESLAKDWGLETVDPSYFFTQRRWDEHAKGLQRGAGATVSEDTEALADDKRPSNPNDPSWDGKEYLPQGTVGAVVLDSAGTICAATSTGGLTNKLPGRIGDTPTLGAGYWAEEWLEELSSASTMPYAPQSPLDKLSRGDIAGVLSDCLPSLSATTPSSSSSSSGEQTPSEKPSPRHRRRAIGLSGTGNGDSFLRVCAARTAVAHSRFSTPNAPLSASLALVAGPGGELQQSAGDRWKVTGEGEGGIIGIELVGSESWVGYDLNCGGMFRAWVDGDGNERIAVFADEDGTEGW
ncbi:putative l-asparaginase precursor protein [Botryosphaeria dothidea]|uniref:L-asparaginase protein n=1 Tax=Botryosphaeria dothidea TaxID=55169 RepID=A0A8H4J1N0_9PEZI|nr:putative l-asparaginase precursor protein [Botryosphaeria dothidea]